jgi:frataxin
MEETLFKAASNQILLDLAEAIENSDEKGELDVEYASGVLTVTLANKKQYVINQHVPMRQIWISSPVSGAGHYDYVDGYWKNTRGGQDLLELVQREFNIAL